MMDVFEIHFMEMYSLGQLTPNEGITVISKRTRKQKGSNISYRFVREASSCNPCGKLFLLQPISSKSPRTICKKKKVANRKKWTPFCSTGKACVER